MALRMGAIHIHMSGNRCSLPVIARRFYVVNNHKLCLSDLYNHYVRNTLWHSFMAVAIKKKSFVGQTLKDKVQIDRLIYGVS